MDKDSLILLPHLDDEFAMSPILKNIISKAGKNCKFIFFAERNNESKKIRQIRREECIKSLNFFGVNRSEIIFMNDHLHVDDLKIYEKTNEIKSYLSEYHQKNPIYKIYTLNLEGGHPDHDSLALIVDKFCTKLNIKKYFLPSYNSRKTLFFPISVLRPLKSQLRYFKTKKINVFDWYSSLKIAYVYKSERSAFLKLLPFLVIKTLFSYQVYLTNKISIETVDWENSLTKTRYKVDINSILQKV